MMNINAVGLKHTLSCQFFFSCTEPKEAKSLSFLKCHFLPDLNVELLLDIYCQM